MQTKFIFYFYCYRIYIEYEMRREIWNVKCKMCVKVFPKPTTHSYKFKFHVSKMFLLKSILRSIRINRKKYFFSFQCLNMIVKEWKGHRWNVMFFLSRISIGILVFFTRSRPDTTLNKKSTRKISKQMIDSKRMRIVEK